MALPVVVFALFLPSGYGANAFAEPRSRSSQTDQARIQTAKSEQADLRDALPEQERLTEAKASFSQGVAAFKDGHFEEAKTLFERAERLAHHPDTLFNLALAQQANGDHLAAWRSFERLLRQASNDEEREDIRTAQAPSQPHVAWVRVFTTTQDSVCLDGRLMHRDRDGVPVELTTPGRHQIDIGALRQRVELRGGEHRTLQHLPPPQSLPSRNQRPVWALTGISLGGTAMAAGFGLGAGMAPGSNVRVGLGLGAAVSGGLALATSAVVLAIHRRARRASPRRPPPPRSNARCPR